MIDSIVGVVLKNAKRGDIKQSKKEKILYFLSFVIVFVFLLGVMTSFSIYITNKLKVIHQEYAFCNLLLFMNYLILLTKSIFESINVLYFSKDLRIFLRMPVKIRKLLNAKFINMIISEYEMECIMLAVPMITYGIIMHVGMSFYLYMIAILLVIPIIPIMLMSFIIAIVMRFTNMFKNKSKTLYITLILVTLVSSLILGTMGNNSNDISIDNFTNMILRVNGLSEEISNYFIILKPIMNILINYGTNEAAIELVAFVIESLLVYYIFVELISKIYLKGAIGATINATSKKSIKNKKIKDKDFKQNKIKKSYLIKELKTIIRSPIFFIQCIIIPILNPILMFAVLYGLVSFAESVGLNLWIMLKEISLSTFGVGIFMLCAQVFFMMNFSSIIAISKDESTAKLVKYIPIDLERQAYLKMKIGTAINIIPMLFITYFYNACSGDFKLSIILFIILFVINIIGEKYKIMIDFKKPQMNWDSEYQMMKQNTNVMYELFYTLVFSGIIIVFSFIIKNINVYLIIVLSTLIIINLIYKLYFRKNINKIFSKVY